MPGRASRRGQAPVSGGSGAREARARVVDVHAPFSLTRPIPLFADIY